MENPIDRWNDNISSRVVKAKKRKVQPLCLHCDSFSGFNGENSPVCEAFPGGIPDKFWSGNVDHTTPYDGDNGITFQPFTS